MIIDEIQLGDGNLSVTKDLITYYYGNTHQSMERKCIGSISHIQMTFMNKNNLIYSIRFVFFSAIVFAVNLFIGNMWLLAVGFILLGYGFLALTLGSIFGLMGYHDLEQMFFKPFFGIKGYQITITNTCGGKQIIFNIYDNELGKKARIEKFRLDSNAEIQKPLEKPDTNNLSDIEKISELYQKGILTEEEFIQKKKQLLNI